MVGSKNKAVLTMERHDHRPNKCKKNLDDYAAAKYHILLVVIISNDRQAEFN